MAVHERLAGGRWMELTLMEQLANVGSEVDRAIRAAASGRVERRDRAIERALELFDLTAADDRWRGPPRREVLRAREEFCTLLLGGDAIPPRIRRQASAGTSCTSPWRRGERLSAHRPRNLGRLSCR